MRTVLIGLFSLAFVLPANARYHHLTHKYAKYLTSRHFHHEHKHLRMVHLARKQPRFARRHAGNPYVGSLSRVTLDGGQSITVNRTFADRFIGFFHDLFQREAHLPEIGCYAAHGHMPLPWGRHPAGEACDVGQRSRNKAWAPMYHVGELARKWALTDGCSWSNPDCGHVQINRAVAIVPAIAAKKIRLVGAWPL